MRAGGVFNGTGILSYICIGFVPDYVTLWNLEGTQDLRLVWNKGMSRASEVVEGIQYSGADVTATALTKGLGILQYFGGDALGSSGLGTTTYGGAATYLKPDHFDYRRLNNAGLGIIGDATEEDIDTWTLDNATNFTGKFNGAVGGTYIGEGSSININGKTYSIVAFSSDGSDDNDLTLNLPAKSGPIYAIHGMYDYKPMVAGEVTKPGFCISTTTNVVNIAGALTAFEAGQYDR